MNVSRKYANALGAAICARAAWWIDSKHDTADAVAAKILLDCARRAAGGTRYDFEEAEPLPGYDALTLETMREERSGWQDEVRDILKLAGEGSEYIPRNVVAR